MAFQTETISLGAGKIYEALLGSAEPLDISVAWDAAWKEIGYTEEGSEFSYEFSTDPVEVAESYDPVFYKTTGRTGTVSFSMAENTVRNLTVAFNGGTVTTNVDGSFNYEPPEPGEEVRRMLAFESEDGTERWIFRQVFQGGSVSMARRKGADKTLLPVEFRLEKPTGAVKPFRAIYAATRSGGATATP